MQAVVSPLCNNADLDFNASFRILAYERQDCGNHWSNRRYLYKLGSRKSSKAASQKQFLSAVFDIFQWMNTRVNHTKMYEYNDLTYKNHELTCQIFMWWSFYCKFFAKWCLLFSRKSFIVDVWQQGSNTTLTLVLAFLTLNVFYCHCTENEVFH